MTNRPDPDPILPPEIDNRPASTLAKPSAVALSEAERQLDSALRALADETHPRRAFVSALRGELETRQAAAPGTIWQKFSWLRPVGAQAALVLLLIGLVVLGFQLTPHLAAPKVTPRPGQVGRLTPLAASGTPFPTQVNEGAGTPTPIPVDYSRNGNVPPGALARLGRGQILSLSAAPDGRLAVGSTAGVCLYNAGLTEDWCAWLELPVWRVLFSPSGEQIAAAVVETADSGRVFILDARTGSQLAERMFLVDWAEHGETDPPMAWDPSGAPRLAVAQMETEVVAWNWQQNGIDWGPTRVHTSITGLDWAKTGDLSTLAVGQNDGLAFLDGSSGEIKEQHDATWQAAPVLGIQTVAYSADGAHLAYTHAEGLVMMEVPQPGISAFPAKGGGRIAWELDPSAKAPRLALQTGSEIHILRPTTEGDQPGIFPARANSPLVWDGRGNLFYVTPENLLGKYSAGEPEGPVNDRYNTLAAYLTWSAQNELVSANSGVIRRWSQGMISRVTGPSEAMVAFSADGERALYYQAEQGLLTVWDAVNNQQVSQIDVGTDLSAVTFSDDHLKLAVATGNGIFSYDTQTGARLAEGHYKAKGFISNLAWRPQAHSTAQHPIYDIVAATWTGLNEKGLNMSGLSLVSLDSRLDWTSLELDQRDGQTYRPVWSPDGRWLAAVANQNVLVVDVEIDQITWQLDRRSAIHKTDPPNMLPGKPAFSPDSRSLATSYEDALVVWDLETGRPTHSYTAPRPILSMAYGAGGLATGLVDGTILLWDLGIPLQPSQVANTPTPVLPGESPAPPAEGTPTPLPTPEPVTTQAPITPTPITDRPTHLPYPTPPATDLSMYDLSAQVIDGPDGWTAEILRGEVPPGSDRPQDYTRISLARPGLEKAYVFENWTQHGLSEPHADGFQFSPDGQYFFFYYTLNVDGCAITSSDNLHRITLATGADELVPPAHANFAGQFSLSPSGQWLAAPSGYKLIIEDIASIAPDRILDIVDIPMDQGMGLIGANMAWDSAEQWFLYDVVRPSDECHAQPKLEGEVAVNLSAGEAHFYRLPAQITLGEQNVMIDEKGQRYISGGNGPAPTPEPPWLGQQQQAAIYLQKFLDLLAAARHDPRKYAEAAKLYGGDAEELRNWLVKAGGFTGLQIPSADDIPALLRFGCEQINHTCLPLRRVVSSPAQPAADGAFTLQVEFLGLNGQPVTSNPSFLYLYRLRPGLNGEYRVLNLFMLGDAP